MSKLFFMHTKMHCDCYLPSSIELLLHLLKQKCCIMLGFQPRSQTLHKSSRIARKKKKEIGA